MARRLVHCALLVAIALALGSARAAAVRTLGPLGDTSADSAYWYYCPPGLVETGGADALANGRYCAFWLLKSFPLGGDSVPSLNGTPVPGLDVPGLDVPGLEIPVRAAGTVARQCQQADPVRRR
jgi:hypothetical protein